ncbi:MAG: hypothetical protein EOP52_12440 [Sphingobacteriales bacterium]|nr:MAG: hypothetical protein EOP52_12440 [Sphingobacteriales bacterium]
MELQVKRLEDMAQWLEANADKYETTQSITVLMADAGALVKVMAFANGQMAQAKRELNEAKVRAYNGLIASQRATGFDISPMLARDYVAAQCSKEAYAYDLAERCSRTCVHTIDTLRTCISALKEELRHLQYAAA